MSDKAKFNPFGNPDGTPKTGKDQEFFEYARQHASDNRNDIPPSDAELMTDIEKAMGEKMDSDPEESK